MTPSEKSARFLSLASQFRLGDLPTEMRHPLTFELSALAEKDLTSALELFKRVEIDAVRTVFSRLPEIERLSSEIRSTLQSGGRVFFCGCGATGRLSLSLETLWRELSAQSQGLEKHGDQVFSFIAGGDYALVRSIENFEDHPEYGARQLNDFAFSTNDLLVATTEGGETPFVIGATEEAARISKRAPWFLFCNPSDLLSKKLDRCRKVIRHPHVVSVAIETGPMALAGSTRLQASTALMLATGAALFSASELENREPRCFIDEFLEALSQSDFSQFSKLIEIESEIYASGRRCLHVTDDYGITVVTDTTERSPTFSLVPFENVLEPNSEHSWTYLCAPSCTDSAQALRQILKREPRSLTWPGFEDKYGSKVLEGFDFSLQARHRRRRELGSDSQMEYQIKRQGESIQFSLGQSSLKLQTAQLERRAHLLIEHLVLKSVLNASSTLVMGRLGRFQSNVMLYVRPTNNKLIDRGIRYLQALLLESGRNDLSYEQLCLAIFETLETLPAGEPAVLRVFERISGSSSPNAIKKAL